MVSPGLMVLFSCILFDSASGFRSTMASKRRQTVVSSLKLTAIEQEIGLWTAAFSVSHIGMSAIRQDLITACGNVAESLNVVDRPDWRLPDIWPGDEAGQAIFPTTEIAGRQLYRIGYTAVSFTTLGSSFLAYLESLSQQPPVSNTDGIFLWIASTAWAISITSLFNPSPLSLVPVYEGSKEEGAILVRDDTRKLQATGMTRITRHPLILPVIPWGLATAMSMGGQPRDFLLFGGLAIYAVAGCAAQDLRVIREEGSVGTVFSPGAGLQDFFAETSFLPFGAVLDGRQSLSDIAKEVPWWAFGLGLGVGYKLQLFLLEWLQNQ